MMLKRKRFKRVFKVGLCGDWVEIYRKSPQPKTEGAFFLAFRENGKRKVLPLLCGITIGGVESLIKSFKQCRINLTNLVLLINDRSHDKRFPPVSLV